MPVDMIGKAHKTLVLGTTITWGEMGAGDPLVLLHGITDSHRNWRRAAPFLARRFRVLMPDLPGHGYSGRPDAPYTLSWYGDVVSAWMESIGIPRAHICGHSYGGGVAQWMVLEHRDRINRLALTSAGGLGREVAVGMRLASFPFLGPMITPFAMRMAFPFVLRLMPRTFGHMEPEEQERAVQMSRIPDTDRAFRRTLEGVIDVFGQHVQTRQRAGEVSELPPVAIFWGTKDPIIPVRHGHDAVANSEGITLTTYKGCGHYPHLDVPEQFSNDLIAFLTDPKRPSATLRSLPPNGWLRDLLRRPEVL